MKSGGFLNFYIAALITGSILGMDTKLLIKAGLKYLPVIIGGVFVLPEKKPIKTFNEHGEIDGDYEDIPSDKS